jgi:hypothetical protein
MLERCFTLLRSVSNGIGAPLSIFFLAFSHQSVILGHFGFGKNSLSKVACVGNAQRRLPLLWLQVALQVAAFSHGKPREIRGNLCKTW